MTAVLILSVMGNWMHMSIQLWIKWFSETKGIRWLLEKPYPK